MFHEVLGWNQMAVIWGVGLVTALYTMKGGLSAVVFTDAIQTVVLILAAVIMTAIGLHEVGGYEVLRTKLDPSMFSMVKPATDPDLPWPGVFIGVFLLGTFYFSMDQVLVQRVFAAKNLNEGRLGATFCAFLKTLNPIILVGPGILAAAPLSGTIQGRPGLPDDAQEPDAHRALGPDHRRDHGGPDGTLKRDLQLRRHLDYARFLPQVPPRGQSRPPDPGRTDCRAVRLHLGCAWAPLIGQSKSMFIYLQNVQAYLMIPFAGIFLFAIFWKRINTPGVLGLHGDDIGPLPRHDAQ